MMRLPRFRVRTLLIAVALTATLLGYHVEKRRRADRAREVLSSYAIFGSREHFVSAAAWRRYLAECERAEIELGIEPRHFAGAARSWTNEDERAYNGPVSAR